MLPTGNVCVQNIQTLYLMEHAIVLAIDISTMKAIVFATLDQFLPLKILPFVCVCWDRKMKIACVPTEVSVKKIQKIYVHVRSILNPI